MLRVTFTDKAARDSFAERFKVDSHVGENQLDIGWHLMEHAKYDATALDYDELALLQGSSESNAAREFVVKGDPATFGPHATVIKDLGNGYYHVSSTNGALLGDHVDHIDDNGSGITLLANTVSMDDMSQAQPADIDPTSSDAQWHRIRVVSRYRPLQTSFSLHEIKYKSKPEVIVMDSGIDFTHPEFDYPNFEYENFYTCFPGQYNDDKGHGTALTSLIAGKNLGVSSYVKIVNVKIGSSLGNATVLQIGEAIDAILARVASDPNKTRIVNMSWGTSRSSYLDSKVEALLAAGVSVIAAAGNQGIDVSLISPAGMTDVITVGAIDKYDIPSGMNNIAPSDAGVTTGFGLQLDLFAPGEQIVCAKNGGLGYHILSGTSLAAPIVAGIGAIISSVNENMVPYNILKKNILDTVTKDALLFEDDRFSENQNRLAYIFLSDSAGSNKANGMTSYLGYLDHNSGGINELVAELKTGLNPWWVQQITDHPFTYSIDWKSSALEASFGQCVSIDPNTGTLTVKLPETPISLPPDTKLQLVSFYGVAENNITKMESPQIIFFYCNPNIEVSKADLTLALTETNSISFYTSWGYIK